VAQRIDENDKPFIIECEAEGEPAPKYVDIVLTLNAKRELRFLLLLLPSTPVN
jgi:hypothetical protein